MLSGIRIHNYLFVPSAELRFGQGMTVLTGETGAGKSILVGAISLIFGESAFAPEPWDREKAIYLEADFRIRGNRPLQDKLEELGHADGEELTLARQISESGRSAYYINGRKVAAGLMKELRPLMIDFHHQRDQQRLLQSSYQLEVLDAYAETTAARAAFASLIQHLRSDIKSLEELKLEQERNKQLAELYRFQLEELEAAAILEGEDKELQREFDLLSHARQISEAGTWISHNLFEQENSAQDLIRAAVNSLDRYAGLDERVAQLKQSLTDSLQILEDCAAEVSDIGNRTHDDPARLETIQQRLDLINSLLHKHRVRDLVELRGLFATRLAQIGDFDAQDERINRLALRIQRDFQELHKLGSELSEKRLSAANHLAGDLQSAIRDLAIPEARFEINIDKKASSEMLMQDYVAAVSLSGADICEFRFSANLGAGLKALAEVASGGELSRVLLAIKKVLAGRMEPRLMILDEIDAGIGGKTADAVAAVIRELARTHVVLCVTHLASIAAVADWHMGLSKTSDSFKTVIAMRPLDADGRIRELARMLSGHVTEASLKHAKELLDK